MNGGRRNGKTPLGTLPPAALAAIGREWATLRSEQTGLRWIVRPGERGEADTTASARKVGGTLAAPQDERAILDGNLSPETPDGPHHDGVEGG